MRGPTRGYEVARTINEMARERRAAIRRLRHELKGVGTSVEKSVRRVTRILERRTKVPEVSDLDQLTVEFVIIQKEFDEYQRSIADALRDFTLI